LADNAHTEFYRHLLGLRREHLVPHLPGSVALGAQVLANAAVTARWRLGNGRLLQIDINLSAAAVAHTTTQPIIFATPADQGAQLPPYSARVSLSPVGEHP
jgi:maltooligosyltrehalose trehalohydrolase